MSNKIQVFDLFPMLPMCLSLWLDSRKKANRQSNVCKITDATIVFVGDKVQHWQEEEEEAVQHYLSITLSKEQSEEFTWWDKEKSLSRTMNTKVRSSSKWNWVRAQRSWITTRNWSRSIYEMYPVPDLREYKDATIDIVVTGTSNEFTKKDTGEVLSFVSLVSLDATQITKSSAWIVYTSVISYRGSFASPGRLCLPLL